MSLTINEGNMKRLELNDIADLGNLLYELASEEKSDVTAVLFYKDTQKLLRWFMQYEDINIGQINFKHKDFGYEDEYYITLHTNLDLDIKPAKKNSNYIYINTDALFLDGNANSRIVVINSDCLHFELVFEEDECLGFDDNDESNSFINLINYINSIIYQD